MTADAEGSLDTAAWHSVPFVPGLAAGVASLCAREWPNADAGRAEYVRWQYDANPAGRAFSALARTGAGELTAQFGAIPLRMAVDGEERFGALALNVVTDSAMRGRGIFTALGRACDEQMAAAGVTVAWALPNRNSFPGFVGRLGYTHIGDAPLLVRPVNVRRLAESRVRLPGVGVAASILAKPFVAPLPGATREVSGVSVAAVERFGSEFENLWPGIRGRERVMVVRDAAYLNWRFVEIPTRTYQVFAARAGGAVAGYVALRTAELFGLQAGLIVDLIASNEAVREALLSHALAHFATQDVDLLAALMLTHTAEHASLRRHGFRPVPKLLLPLPFRVVARGGDVVRDLRNWFLTMGDYDVV
jgi:N-acetylglutamate synthase-like GNAT family acetyltransferase